MSGLVKGVKKVFKGVGKIIKKVAPFALPIAAAVATVGGFMGVPLFAGGFGGTVGRLLGNGVLGKAVTFAGYGGLAGGAIGGATGGAKGLVKGLGMGQLAGAATGAMAGLMSGPTPAPGATQPTQSSVPYGQQQGLSQAGTGAPSFGGEFGTATIAVPTQMNNGFSAALPPGALQSNAAQGITNAAYALPSSNMAAQQGLGAAAGSGMRGGLSEMERVAMIGAIGPQIGPAMGALFKKAGDDNPGLAIENARRSAINKNYALPTGITPPPTSTARLPVERYIYDEASGRIVKTWN